MRHFLCVFFLAFSLACTRSQPRASNSIRFQISGEPTTLDSVAATTEASHLVLFNLQEGLTRHDEWSNVVPALAEKWSVSSEGRIYTFTLKDAKWSDGVSVRAQDFVFAWLRLLDPNRSSPNSELLGDVENAESFHQGKAKETAVGVKALDDRRLEVKLQHSSAHLLHRLAHPALAPQRQDIFDARPADYADAPQLRSTGPYRLTQWTHGKRLLLEENPYFYGLKPFIPTVELVVLPDASDALHKYELGELDCVSTLPISEIDRLRPRPDYRRDPLFEVSFATFNVTAKPFDSREVRRAFVHSSPRKDVVARSRLGALPARAWIPSGLFGHEDHVGLDYNPALAKTYLNKAGYRDPATFPAIRLTHEISDSQKISAETMQANWRNILGVPTIDIQAFESKTYQGSVEETAPHIFRASLSTPFRDPQPFLDYFLSTNEWNLTGWKNSSYDSLVTAAGRSTNAKERLSIFRKVQRLLLEDEAVLIPLYQVRREYLVRNALENLTMDGLGMIRFAQAKFVPERQNDRSAGNIAAVVPSP